MRQAFLELPNRAVASPRVRASRAAWVASLEAVLASPTQAGAQRNDPTVSIRDSSLQTRAKCVEMDGRRKG